MCPEQHTVKMAKIIYRYPAFYIKRKGLIICSKYALKTVQHIQFCPELCQYTDNIKQMRIHFMSLCGSNLSC
jgi:hypothetical protein